MYDSVLNQLRNAGLLVDQFEADTSHMIRCKAEGDTGKKVSGWYRIYSVVSQKGNTYYVGTYGNWKNNTIPDSGLSIEFDEKTLSPIDKKALQDKQKQAQQQAEHERKAKAKEAAKRAREIWAGLPDSGGSEYLKRKKVAAFGIRFSRGAVVVPLTNIAKQLVGLQFIYADGTKKFLSGTPKSEAFHLIGDIQQDKPLIIAEGYATAASLHMATHYPAIVAFDAGNLVKVATVIRKAYPDLPLIIAADDDDNQKGWQCAQQASKNTQAIIALPTFKNKQQQTDFNDLHVSEGLDTVAAQIKYAMENTSANNTPKQASPSTKSTQTFLGFTVNDKGVFYTNPNNEDDENANFRVCARLDVLAWARVSDNEGWSLLVRFLNRDNRPVELLLPASLFASDSTSKLLEPLYMAGLEVDPHRNSKKRLSEYLQRAETTKRVKLVHKLGWCDGAYVLPYEVIGNSKEPIHYHSGKNLLNTSDLKGSLEGWQKNVAVYCKNNPVVMFATALPFAAPLLELLQINTIGFHMLGDSSLGKSSIATLAGSVCGGVDYCKTWNTTAAALEPMAAEHSDSLLILDEIKEAEPLTIGKTVYQLGNQKGKSRATDTGAATRKQHEWRLVWLSNGEKTLKNLLAEAGKTIDAGMEMRMLHINADLNKTKEERETKGVYQDLHGFAHGEKLSDHIKLEVAKNYGHAFREFVTKLTALDDKERQKLIQSLRRKIETFKHKNLSDKASGQARRAANGFGVIAQCGELASFWGITGWDKGEAEKAANELFQHWLNERGGEGSAENNAIIEHITHELQTKGESHFTRWDKDEPKIDTHQPRSAVRWGYRKVSETHEYNQGSFSDEEFYIFKTAFKKELCKSFPYRRVCELLMERGILVTHKGRGYSYQAILPCTGKKKIDVFYIKMSALQELMSKNHLDSAA